LRGKSDADGVQRAHTGTIDARREDARSIDGIRESTGFVWIERGSNAFPLRNHQCLIRQFGDWDMPRRRVITQRALAPDPLYGSVLLSKFINCVMYDGKRSTAERIMYKAFDIIKEKTSDDPVKVFKKAVDNVKPSLEVKSRRVGGSNFQVPTEVSPTRRLSLSIRWLVSSARQRGDGKTMEEKLANELLDASNLRGGAVKKREDVHRMAEANKAFAHYRW
jgi:small subunit ribosomal protein S7